MLGSDGEACLQGHPSEAQEPRLGSAAGPGPRQAGQPREVQGTHQPQALLVTTALQG